MRKNRDAKRKEAINQIRKFLLKEDRTWQQLLNEIKRSPATLSVFLEELMKNGEISAYTDSKDRRITYYTLNSKKKTNAEVKRFETTEFILSLKSPIYAEIPFEDTFNGFRYYGKTGVFFEGSESDLEKLDITPTVKIDLSDLEEVIKISNKFALTIIFERREKV